MTPPAGGARAFPAVAGHQAQAVFVYSGEDWVEVGAVARFAPGTLEPDRKSFRQFRREGDDWVPGLKGRHLPLYRLPEVLEGLPERAVLVVEGEGKVEALAALDLLATTNSGGAGKWRPAHSQFLKDADVVVLPDNDQPGRKHAQQVARSLHGVARRVRLLELPDLPEAGDIVNWLDAGGTREQLVSMLDTAAEWRPTVEVGDDWGVPEPFGVTSEAEPFPIKEGLPPCLSEYACALAETVKIDVTAPAVLAPVVVSTSAGNTHRVRVSRSHAEPNLARYVAWVAPSGERKSEGFRRTVQPLDSWSRLHMPGYGQQVMAFKSDKAFHETRAQHAERKGAQAQSEVDAERWRCEAMDARQSISRPPRRPDLYIGDVTSETLVRLIDDAGGGFGVLSPDARHVVDALMGRYRKDGQTDDSVYLRAHGGDRIDRGRIGAQAETEFRVIEHPSLGLGICLQPDKLQDLAACRALMDSGLLPRFNVVQPRSLVGGRIETGQEAPLDAALATQWECIVHAIIDVRWARLHEAGGGSSDALELTLDPEAMELRRVFANEVELQQAPGGDLFQARAFGSKAAGEAARLSGIFHLAEMANQDRIQEAHEALIPAATWAMAEIHQRWQLAETLRNLALATEGQQSRLARRVLEWAAREPQKRREVAGRDLVAARIVDRAGDVTQLFTWLSELGWARQCPQQGREKTPRWAFHPIVFEAQRS